MKNLIFLLLLNTGMVFGQVETTILNLSYDMSIEFGPQTDTIDVNNDGIGEFIIQNWKNSNNGVIEIVVLDKNPNDSEYGSVKTDIFNLIQDCGSATGTSLYGYIYSSDLTINHTVGIYKTPVYFELNDGFHYGLLYIEYNGLSITIKACSYNNEPDQLIDCTYLSLIEYTKTQEKEEFEYYDTIGQKVDNPVGFTIKVNKSTNKSEKVFINP